MQNDPLLEIPPGEQRCAERATFDLRPIETSRVVA
jgi:hypothetical protein